MWGSNHTHRSGSRVLRGRTAASVGGRNMATSLHPNSVSSGTTGTTRASTALSQPAYQAFVILYVGFVVLPIVAGADKFFDVLVNWDAYLAPIVPQTLNMTPHSFMMIVGVIEIAAGL